jgi:uncharacterized membrane protein YcaP (DUF421 family)
MKNKNVDKGLVSIKEYQKIKLAIEGKDNYHIIRKEGKQDIIPKQTLKRISINELKELYLKDLENSNILLETLH